MRREDASFRNTPLVGVVPSRTSSSTSIRMEETTGGEEEEEEETNAMSIVNAVAGVLDRRGRNQRRPRVRVVVNEHDGGIGGSIFGGGGGGGRPFRKRRKGNRRTTDPGRRRQREEEEKKEEEKEIDKTKKVNKSVRLHTIGKKIITPTPTTNVFRRRQKIRLLRGKTPPPPPRTFFASPKIL